MFEWAEEGMGEDDDTTVLDSVGLEDVYIAPHLVFGFHLQSDQTPWDLRGPDKCCNGPPAAAAAVAAAAAAFPGRGKHHTPNTKHHD